MNNLAERIAALRPEQRAFLEKQLQKKGLAPAGASIISRRGAVEFCPLSLDQEDLWFVDQKQAGSFAYNISSSFHIKGRLDLCALERSFNEIIRRHEALRTTFPARDGIPYQQIAPSATMALRQVDLSHVPEEAREEEMRRVILAEERAPFDMAQGPLFRAVLVKLKETEHRLSMTLNHIITDRWSFSLLWRELTVLYDAYTHGRPSPLPELPIQFADYAVWQREWLRGGALDSRLEYWKQQLAGSSFRLDLPTDYRRPAIQTFRGKRYYSVQSTKLWGALKALSQRENVTLYTTLLAAFYAFLHRYTGQEDIIVGSPFANRNRVETEALIGYMLNMLALRADVSGNPAFRELLGRAREVTTGAFANSELPFGKLVQELRPERDLSRSAIFQVTYVLVDFQDSVIEHPELEMRRVETEAASAKFDLMLGVRDKAEEPMLIFEYCTDLFRHSTIERMMRHFETMLEGIVADPSRRLSELPLLTAPEQFQLLEEWNRTGREYRREQCLHQLFEEQAARTPERVAVVCEDQKLSYRELNGRANQLAHRLRSLGVGPEARVGVLLERSSEVIVALLGILKAGGAYVIFEPGQPRQRLLYMLEESGARVLLTEEKLLANLEAYEGRAICLDAQRDALALESDRNPCDGPHSDNLAYVIFTSGSTGRPKGVAVAHRQILNYLNGIQERADFPTGGSFATVSTFSADLGNTMIFPSLCFGGTLHVITQERATDPAALADYFKRHPVDCLKIVPSHLAALLSGADAARVLPRQRLVLGGEALRRELVEKISALAPECVVINHYGPTETTVGVLTHRAETCEDAPSSAALPIGRPIANTRAYVLDCFMRPAAVGVPGELYIGGEGLSRGYINRPGPTAERFVPDPFSGEPGARLYRTGDMARWLPEGVVEFLGRADDQVKLHGFRIEPGEVESALVEHAEVRECVVVVREDETDNKRLVAYVVSDKGDLTSAELRQYVKERVPEQMVPSSFVLLSELPLTPNGKIDRQRLPAPEQSVQTESYVAPRTPIEEMLCGLWAEVLRVKTVGVEDNFFELGGHSLMATQLISKVREVVGVEVALRAFFEQPTIAGMARNVETLLRADAGVEAPPVRKVSREQPLPLSFAQQRLWLIDRLEQGSNFYNTPTALRLEGELQVDALRRALGEIVRRHESLRTRFAEMDGEPVQLIAEAAPFPLPVIDLSGLPEAEREAEARRLAFEEARSPFNLSTGPLLRAALLSLLPDEHIILLTIHHIVSDGWSTGVLIREIMALYEAFSRGEASPLPELSIQYADYAAWQREWLQGEVLEKQLRYWREQLSGSLPVLKLPFDRPRPAVQSFRGARHSQALPPALCDGIRALNRQHGCTLFMTLLAAFQALLHRYTRQDDILVGTAIANRNRAESEALIGFFVNQLVMRMDLSGDPSFAELLRRAREMALGAYAHQDMPFEKLVEELQPERSLGHSPLVQVVFGLQNAHREVLETPGLRFSSVETQSELAKFDLALTFTESPEGLLGAWTYNTDLFDAATIERMAGHFQKLLEAVTTDPGQSISRLSLLDEAERYQVLHQWNDTAVEYPAARSVHQLFEEQAALVPERVAVSSGDEKQTYAELNERANQLAHHLMSLGVGRDVLVGILMERSVEMVVAMLATLKAGGAYVPLDPQYPLERLSFMMEDTGLAVLLTQERLAERAPTHWGHTIYLDAERESLSVQSKSNPAIELEADNLAYVIYTSGSTGRPKGVAVSHRAILRLLCSASYVSLGPSEVLLHASSPTFDAATFELWGALINGGRCVLFDERVPTARSLGQIIRTHGVTTMWLTSSLFNTVVDEAIEELRGVRQLLVGGEALSAGHVRQALAALPETRLINGYGPTEATTFTCCQEVRAVADGATSVPIGGPIQNTRVYVLDERMQPVPVGVPGELYVGGDALARGYLGRTALTAESFVPDPFGEQAGGRLYRTGDVVRYRRDGSIEYVGRDDAQVKVRGFRIELGEIEAALGEHAAVRECAVSVRGEGAGKRLLAYVVWREDGETEAGAVREYLRERLPEYMVPNQLVTLDQLPLTSNGKLDRRALPEPERWGEQGSEFEAPQTELEELVAGIWCEVLKVERVSRGADFFELGGHSLLATQVISRIQTAFGLELALRTLFEKPTLAEFASAIEDTILREVENLTEENVQSALEDFQLA
jgi:amino acid adenylation domain-containing protein